MRIYNFISVVILFLSLNVFSDEICGSKIIKIGESMHRIKLLCGEPLSKEVVGEIKLNTSSGEEKLYITEWVYDKQGKLLVLTFHGSVLSDMIKLDK